jgi:ABC-type branched-subunit amino acid transport system ATPase component
VDDVSLTVSRSSIHGLVGSNGSGKTTLLNLISGYHRLDGGEILIGNERIGGGVQSAARARIARTFQTPKLIAERSVLDNLLAASEQTNYARDASSFLRLPRARRIDRSARGDARLSLEALGLDDVADVEASELPHGLRRLVEIARALVLRPAFLLLDEPAAGLSGDEIERLELALDAIRQAGVGVLLIEHNVPFVSRLADVVTVLHLGQCIAQGAPSVLVDDARVAEAFLGADAGVTARRTNTLIEITERATENG